MAAISTNPDHDDLRRVTSALGQADDAVDKMLARLFVLAAVVAVLCGLLAGFASAAPAGDVEMARSYEKSTAAIA